jgi:hypothetical protein
MFERPIDRENEYEADFALGGEVEFDELEDEAVDLELLDARVQAARLAGA